MDKTTILEQLFEKDYVVKEVEIIPGKVTAKLRNIDYESQATLEEHLSEMGEKVTNRQFFQKYSLMLLSFTLESYGKTTLEHPEQWAQFLSKKSVSVLQKLVDEQRKLEKEIKAAINLEDIDKTFFPGAEQADDSEPLQKESTSDKKVVSEKP